MELEHMRELLAKAMGWESNYGDWMSGSDGKWVWEMSLRQWHPDTDWAQCGLVIDAMRAKGWTWHVTAYADGDTSVTLTHNESVWRGEYWSGEGHLSEPHARMLAAARSLEATDD